MSVNSLTAGEIISFLSKELGLASKFRTHNDQDFTDPEVMMEVYKVMLYQCHGISKKILRDSDCLKEEDSTSHRYENTLPVINFLECFRILCENISLSIEVGFSDIFEPTKKRTLLILNSLVAFYQKSKLEYDSWFSGLIEETEKTRIESDDLVAKYDMLQEEEKELTERLELENPYELREEYKRLKRNRSLAKDRVSEVHANIRDKKNKLEEGRKDLQETCDTIKDLENVCENQKNQIVSDPNAFFQDYQTQKRELEEAEEENEALTQELAKDTEEYEFAEDRLETLNRLNEFLTMCVTRSSEVNGSRKEMQDFRAELIASRPDFIQKEEELEQLRVDYREMTARNQTAKGETDHLSEDQGKKDTFLKHTVGRCARTLGDMEEEMAVLQTELERLEKEAQTSADFTNATRTKVEASVKAFCAGVTNHIKRHQ